MKNKLYKYLLIFFFSIFIKSIVHSQDQFNFDVTEVQLLDEGNIYIGSKKDIIPTDDGVIFFEQEFKF